jgi:GH15 family glucan-1,4-alpha-glucosidase
LIEQELPHLCGYANSRPVRIGNAAYNQTQNDIYGHVLDIMYLYYAYYAFEQPKTKAWRLARFLVNQIKSTWRRKDNGIWEFRGRYEHFTYSKLMCFVGVDRAIKLAQYYNKEEYVHDWLPLRDAISEDIIKHGYSEEQKAFTMFYGSNQLDASILQMTYHNYLDSDDPRLINTVRSIYNDLRNGYLVQRYKLEDDFGTSTSAFTICSFWLVDALMYIGEEKKAREVYNKLMQRANHVGLFSEDIDIATKQQRGNFPQAYTHVAIINSSILLSEWSTKRKKIDWTTVPKRKEWF